MFDYVPKDDPGKMLWISNFAAWLNANGATHGFVPAEIAAVNTAASSAAAAVAAHVTQQAAARAATAAKNAALAEALALLRATAQRLQSWPTTTDADRAAVGITVRDATPTPVSPDEVKTIPPPLLLLEFGVRGQVTIHWGPNPGNEHENARPAGTVGCQIEFARGGIPEDEKQWTMLAIDTESPYIHLVHDTAPTTYAYRARYQGKKLTFGPYSAPATCTVSV